MRRRLVDIDSVFKAVTAKTGMTAREVASKLGLTGSSSAAYIRTLLFTLHKQEKLGMTLRKGRRGRPATIYWRT